MREASSKHRALAAKTKEKMSDILYRKWRPRSFAELAGQEHVAQTLTNALASGRVAHAYLFAGPRGTGKTSTGRLLGKALNCTDRQGGEACNRCESCLSYLDSKAMDLVELDAASNRGIDEIRSLRDKVAFAPGAGAFKVYLIDEVHMLTEAAFNALLKTLEEPPPHAVFILATTESHKVPATIASRCQRFDFRRVPPAAAVATLERIAAAEAITCETAALELIARQATGSMRDAINLLDQLATSYGNDLTLEHARAGLGLLGDERAARLARQALAADLAGGLETIGSVRDDGLDLRQFQRELVQELRGLLLAKSGIEPAEGVTAERGRELLDAVANVETADLLRALRAFGEADLKADPNSTLSLDIALAECVLGRDVRAETPLNAAATSPPPARQASTPPTPAKEVATPTAPAKRPASPPEPVAGRAASSREAPDPPDRAAAADALTPAAPEAAGLNPQSDPPSPTRTAPAPDRPEPAERTADSVRPGPKVGRPVGQPVEGRSADDPAPLQAARASMRGVYDALRADKTNARKVQVAAFINDVCDIITIDDGGLTLGFKYPFHADKMKDENLQLLTEAVSETMGRALSIRCVHDPNVGSWKAATHSPLVRAAQEMGARVLPPESEEQP